MRELRVSDEVGDLKIVRECVEYAREKGLVPWFRVGYRQHRRLGANPADAAAHALLDVTGGRVPDGSMRSS